MNKDCLKIPTECLLNSYNEAAKHLGLSRSIKLCNFEVNNISEYFWYNDKAALPVFRGTNVTNLPSFRYMSMRQILPYGCFPYNGKIYFFSDEDLCIYRVASLLDICTLMNYVSFIDGNFSDATTAAITIGNQESAVWLLKTDVEEGEEWKGQRTAVIPVFEEDAINFNNIRINSNMVRILSKGDCTLHGDDIYQLEFHPENGLEFVKQEFDFQSLFNF